MYLRTISSGVNARGWMLARTRSASMICSTSGSGTPERERASIQPRALTPELIVRKYMAAMVNEGANVVHQGIALRPLDVDVTFVHGYGFPRYRGGPMKYADMVGLENILADIQEFAKQDPLFWQPSPLLVQLVKEGKNFDSLNR